MRTTEAVNNVISTGMQVAQTYKEDFTGFLIFVFIIATSLLGLIFCGIVWALYKSAIYSAKKWDEREQKYQEIINEVQNTSTEMLKVNKELMHAQEELVRTNAELVRTNANTYATISNKLEALDRIEADMDQVKTKLLILDKKVN